MTYYIINNDKLKEVVDSVQLKSTEKILIKDYNDKKLVIITNRNVNDEVAYKYVLMELE